MTSPGPVAAPARRRLGVAMVMHTGYPEGETRMDWQAAALRDAGHDVSVVALRRPGEAPVEVIDGIAVHRLRERRVLSARLLRQGVEYARFILRARAHLRRLHAQAPVDVVQVRAPPEALVAVATLPRLGPRVVLDIHDVLPEFLATRLGRSMADPRVRLAMFQERFAMRRADCVVTVSEPWRRRLVANGLDPRRSRVVMNLADPRYFRPRTSAPVEPVDAGDPFRIVYHGSITERYGIDVLLRAVAIAARDVPGLELVLHGGGRDLERMRELASALDLGRHAVIEQRLVPTAEVAALVSTAHLAVIPYRGDTFTRTIVPSKMFEYAAMGVPMIASRTEGVVEHFRDSEVILVPPGDHDAVARAIVELRYDPARRARLAEATAGIRERHAPGPQIDAYVRLIESLADPPGVRATGTAPGPAGGGAAG